MIRIYETERGLEPHTDQEFAEGVLKLGSPVTELTELEWERCGGLVRRIEGTIVYGKTKDEEREELAAEIRRTRDELLAKTDWSQFPDNPRCGDHQILAYRQALRDVPGQAGFPYDVVWPTI